MAVGSNSSNLYLWGVQNWEMFHSMKLGMQPQSVHLTSEAKYLTIGGFKADLCVVFEIQ